MIRLLQMPSSNQSFGPGLFWQTLMFSRDNGLGPTTGTFETEEATSFEDAERTTICARTGGLVPGHAQVESVDGIVHRNWWRRDPEWEKFNEE